MHDIRLTIMSFSNWADYDCSFVVCTMYMQIIIYILFSMLNLNIQIPPLRHHEDLKVYKDILHPPPPFCHHHLKQWVAIECVSDVFQN